MVSEYDTFPPDWFPEDAELVVHPECRFCKDTAWFIVKDIPVCPRVTCLDRCRAVIEERGE